jgi:hypothetical protein
MCIERRGRVVSTPASYSGVPGFTSRPGNRLSWLRPFVVFLSLSRRMPGYLKIRPRPLPTKSFQFIIIHLSPYNQCYIVQLLKNHRKINNQTTLMCIVNNLAKLLWKLACSNGLELFRTAFGKMKAKSGYLMTLTATYFSANTVEQFLNCFQFPSVNILL